MTIASNIGVVLRELGRLDDSAAAFRSVVEREPGFVFGHYNLGHTLFLAGNYTGALAAYEEGRRRDPEASPRQSARLALVRFANGDAERAESELWAAVALAPADEREDLLLEAYQIADVLLQADPRLEPHRSLLARIAEAVNAP